MSQKNFEPREKIKALKQFRTQKYSVESISSKIKAFSHFDKSGLISEFTMKELYNFLDRSRTYLNKEFTNFSNMQKDINIAEKINNVISFDTSKGNGVSKNFLPRNFTKIFQSLDRTNQISIYDCESEEFSKVIFTPDKLSTFSFLPFSRYVNIFGRMIVTGGFEVKGKLSHITWVFEDYLSIYKSRIGTNVDDEDNDNNGSNSNEKENNSNIIGKSKGGKSNSQSAAGLSNRNNDKEELEDIGKIKSLK